MPNAAKPKLVPKDPRPNHPATIVLVLTEAECAAYAHYAAVGLGLCPLKTTPERRQLALLAHKKIVTQEHACRSRHYYEDPDA